jgi:hypothetical protein
MILAVPMRRELSRAWFRIVARNRQLRQARDLLGSSDAVIGVPGLAGVFYANNIGTAE